MSNKKPFLTLETAEQIVKQVGTPYHVYDEHGIRETARNLKKAFAWNKGFKEYFAVKATPNPFILKILQEEGCGVDCSSQAELILSRACGFHGRDIMFSSNETQPGEFRLANELGGIINLDDITLIPTLEEECGIPKTVCVRFNPGGDFSLGNTIMDHPKDAKYGMTESQLLESLRVLKSKGAQEFGIHAFLASNTLTNEYYPHLAEILFNLTVKIKEETGICLSFVNMSGGIGIPYRPEDKENDIFAIGEGVHMAYEKILVPNGLGNVCLFTELGRYMLGKHGALITRAIHEKHTYKEYVGVDACACNLMRPAMYGAYHHITVLGKEDQPACKMVDVVGSLCENNDKFAIDRMLPEIKPGDLLNIHDTGAHGFSMGYNYNGKLRSAEILLHADNSFDLIRRAETLQDYFATFDFTDFQFE